jgi:hypothetical protein
MTTFQDAIKSKTAELDRLNRSATTLLREAQIHSGDRRHNPTLPRVPDRQSPRDRPMPRSTRPAAPPSHYSNIPNFDVHQPVSRQAASPHELTDRVAQLRQQTRFYLQQIKQAQAASPQLGSDEHLSEAIERLSVAQEVAIRELRTLSQQVELERQAKHEAMQNAQALRDIAEQRHHQSTWTQNLQQWFSQMVRSLMDSPAPQPPAAKSTSPHRQTRSPQANRKARQKPATALSLRGAVLTIIGAVAARIFLDIVKILFPMLWLPTLIALLAPMAIGVYRTKLTAETGFVWLVRLTLILLGLLIGGRL